MTAKRRKFLLLFVVVLLVAFVVAEIALRLQQSAFRQEHAELEKTFRASQIPGLIYERIPDTEETNSQGFRGPDWQQQKQDNVWRIVMLGDGIARGDGVAFSESLGKRLEHFLNHERTPNAPRAEVLVLAESGYNTAQELSLLEHKALDLAPDLIVWVYALDDPALPLLHKTTPQARYFHQPTSLALDQGRQLLLAARERIQAPDNSAYPRMLHSMYLDQVRRHMAQLAALTAQADVPVLLLVIPVLETEKLTDDPQFVITPMDYGLLDVHTTVTRLGLQNGLGVVEGLDAYMGRTLTELMQSPEERWLPGPAGHELLALQLQKHMLRHGPYPQR